MVPLHYGQSPHQCSSPYIALPAHRFMIFDWHLVNLCKLSRLYITGYCPGYCQSPAFANQVDTSLISTLCSLRLSLDLGNLSPILIALEGLHNSP